MCTGRGSNQGPLGPKSDPLTTAPLRHLNRAVQPQKMARGLKFWINEVEGLYMYYLCGENKGADQLHNYRAVDLRLLFLRMQKAGILTTWLI